MCNADAINQWFVNETLHERFCNSAVRTYGILCNSKRAIEELPKLHNHWDISITSK